MVLIEVQVIPSGGHAPEDQPYYFVDQAIEAIKTSGLKYEVEPLGTTIEGELSAAMAAAVGAHRAALEAGADAVVTVIKVAQRRAGETTMQDLVAKHRRSRD